MDDISIGEKAKGQVKGNSFEGISILRMVTFFIRNQNDQNPLLKTKFSFAVLFR